MRAVPFTLVCSPICDAGCAGFWPLRQLADSDASRSVKRGFLIVISRDSPGSSDRDLRRPVGASYCKCFPRRKLVPRPGAATILSPPDPYQRVNRLFLCPADQARLRACKSRSRRQLLNVMGVPIVVAV